MPCALSEMTDSSDSPTIEGTPVPAADVILSGRDIRRSFPVGERSLEILHGVDMELERGQCVSLMGASGAGKTTLLQMLSTNRVGANPPTLFPNAERTSCMQFE